MNRSPKVWPLRPIVPANSQGTLMESGDVDGEAALLTRPDLTAAIAEVGRREEFPIYSLEN